MATRKIPAKESYAIQVLLGKAYVAAGHAGAYLHTMADLQVYQSNLLSELDSDEGFNPEVVAQLHQATDFGH